MAGFAIFDPSSPFAAVMTGIMSCHFIRWGRRRYCRATPPLPEQASFSSAPLVSVESAAAALEVQVSGSVGEVVPLLAATEGTMQTHLARCDFRADGTMRARWEAGAAGVPASCQ